MKNYDITNSKMEKLFNNIIEQAPLISEEEVASMLFNIPVAKPKGSLKRFLSNHLNTLLIVTATILICITATIFWINSGSDTSEIFTGNDLQENLVLPVVPDTFITDSVSLSNLDKNQTIVVPVSKKSGIMTSPAVVKKDSVSLVDIMKYHGKKSQIFSIRPDKDTTLICKEGTSIEIKANSFVSEKTGENIIGNIQLAFKEFYELSDMVLAGLSTTCSDKLLETSGMLYVSARTGKKKCAIKPGSDLRIGFPYSSRERGMILFNGEWFNDKIDWQPAEEPLIDNVVEIDIAAAPEPETQVFFIVEEMPEFRGGDNALRKYVEQNTVVPYSAIKDSVEGKVYVQFVVDTEGATRNFRVVRSLNKTLDKAAVYLISNMPRWKPGKQRGKPVNVSYTVPVSFSPKQGEFTEEEIRRSKEMDEKLKEIKYDMEAGSFYRNGNEFDELKKKLNKREEAAEVKRYIFSATQLGWINCDRFIKENKPLTTISIFEDKPEETLVTAIFHRFKGIVCGRVEAGEIIFKNVPLGEKITIVAIKTEGDKIYLAINETEITNNMEIIPDYKKVTMKLLKERIAVLDQYRF